MQVLQKGFESALGKLPEQILSHLLATKLKAQGQTLSKRDQRKIVTHILARNTSRSSFANGSSGRKASRLLLRSPQKIRRGSGSSRKQLSRSCPRS
jgi:hypothetical protein